MPGNIAALPKATVGEFLSDLKRTLIEELAEYRKRAAAVNGNKVGEAFVNSRIELLERLVVYVVNAMKQGVFDMKELKVELGEIGSLDDLLKNERGGVIEPAIIEISSHLKVNQFERIDNRQDVLKGITWGHFAGRVYRMRDMGKLAIEFGPMKRKNAFYLVRYTPEMAKRLEEKRLRRKKKETVDAD